MNTVVIEHVKVTELPDAWRKKLSIAADARVTVRIDDEAVPSTATEPTAGHLNMADPAFGIWKDHDATANVDAYVRTLRAPRYRRDGTRNDD